MKELWSGPRSLQSAARERESQQPKNGYSRTLYSDISGQCLIKWLNQLRLFCVAVITNFVKTPDVLRFHSWRSDVWLKAFVIVTKLFSVPVMTPTPPQMHRLRLRHPRCVLFGFLHPPPLPPGTPRGFILACQHEDWDRPPWSGCWHWVCGPRRPQGREWKSD